MNIEKYPYLKRLTEKVAVNIRIPGRGAVSALSALTHFGSQPFTTAIERGGQAAEAAAARAARTATKAEKAVQQKALRDAAQEAFEQMGGQWQPTNPGYGISL